MTALTLELNIALAPALPLDTALTQRSQSIAAATKDTMVMLHKGGVRLSDTPHLTLYQVPILAHDLDTLGTQLETIARKEKAFDLTATGFRYNESERSFEVAYETPARLAKLQTAIITPANNLRSQRLLERDPSGTSLANFMDAEGELGDNIRSFGYGEIGGLFRPHATLNWFGSATDFDSEAEGIRGYADLSGIFDTLIISALGSHGRCAQQIARFKLG